MEVSNLGLLCLVLWWSWRRLGVGDAPGAVSVATILGTVSSVTGSKVPVHFQVAAVGGTRKIRNTTLTQVKVLDTFNSTVKAQRD
jgi:hypothetical protein